MKKISREDKINIRLSEADRDLILGTTFIEQEYRDILKSSIAKSGYITFEITLDDLDFVLGHIAAAANHANDPILESSLDDIFGYLTEIESRYELLD